jgi:hypothetical protein
MHGGHSQVCEGYSGSGSSPMNDQGDHESESDSIEAFEEQPLQVAHSQGGVVEALRKSRVEATKSQNKTLQCKACNMDSEFVPDGMIPCEKCKKVHYCSSDCRDWHWMHGGHSQVCEGYSGSGSSPMNDQGDHESESDSIEAFEEQPLLVAWRRILLRME